MNVNKININQSEQTYYITSNIYDVSYHNNGATFESLSALLSSKNLYTLIPTEVRCGGMTIRFVQSSDNKYMQYRLLSTSFSTTESDWQGVDDEPTDGSDNIVKSGGVFSSISEETARATATEDAIMDEVEQHDYKLNDLSKTERKIDACLNLYERGIELNLEIILQNHYVSNSGDIVQYNTYDIYKPIKLFKNQSINIECIANEVAALSLSETENITENSKLKVVAKGLDSDRPQSFTYSATEDCIVVISCRNDGHFAQTFKTTDSSTTLRATYNKLSNNIEKSKNNINNILVKFPIFVMLVAQCI